MSSSRPSPPGKSRWKTRSNCTAVSSNASAKTFSTRSSTSLTMSSRSRLELLRSSSCSVRNLCRSSSAENSSSASGLIRPSGAELALRRAQPLLLGLAHERHRSARRPRPPGRRRGRPPPGRGGRDRTRRRARPGRCRAPRRPASAAARCAAAAGCGPPRRGGRSRSARAARSGASRCRAARRTARRRARCGRPRRRRGRGRPPRRTRRAARAPTRRRADGLGDGRLALAARALGGEPLTRLLLVPGAPLEGVGAVLERSGPLLAGAQPQAQLRLGGAGLAGERLEPVPLVGRGLGLGLALPARGLEPVEQLGVLGPVGLERRQRRR